VLAVSASSKACDCPFTGASVRETRGGRRGGYSGERGAAEETRGMRERENGGVGVVEKGGDDMWAPRVVVGIE
jgi:hypothetical protein